MSHQEMQFKGCSIANWKNNRKSRALDFTSPVCNKICNTICYPKVLTINFSFRRRKSIRSSCEWRVSLSSEIVDEALNIENAD